MSAALRRAPAAALDAYASDPVVAEARSLHAAALELAPVTQGLHDTARGIRTRLDGVAERHALRREVLVVDDTPPALGALLACLSPIGVRLRAVTHDRTAVAMLRGLGAEVLLVPSYGDVASVWRRHRSAVVVIDEDLRDGPTGARHSGTDIVARSIPREARAIVVTSHDEARASLTDATRTVQAAAVIRTDAGEWGDRLRAEVLRALDDACGGG